MKLPNEEEIKKEISRGQKSLKSAKKLFEEGLLEDAISRSYYAVLHAAKAVLLSENVTVSSHEAVKRLFGMHLIKIGKIELKYSKILSEEQDERYLADYDVAFSPEPDRVEERIKAAEDFCDAMIGYLKKSGIESI
ncbi:MAG: HEPN domain-containing protein [Nitrospinae bacterium]|nr:HEPN domain-containing protein [Nitrospinota bacterium]